MPTHIKAFIIIFVLAITVFVIAKNQSCILDDCADFKRRRNLWFTLTAAAFLSNNYWIYVVIASIAILTTLKFEKHRPSLFVLLLFIVPPIDAKISGFGLINYLVGIDHPRLLSLLILLPTYVVYKRLSKEEDKKGNKERKHWVDIIFISYLVLSVVLHLRNTAVTNVMRYALYAFTDGYLLYYVFSRTLLSKYDFRRVFQYLVIAVGIMCVIAVFERTFHWLLFPSLLKALDLQTNLFDWTMRAGSLRAMASTGHSIALGYVIVIAMGFMLFLRTQMTSKLIVLLVFGVLLAGSYATLSRGPWVGIIVMLLIYIILSPKVIRSMFVWGVAGVLMISVVNATPWGQKLIDLLPFVGTVESENVSYREKLIDNALVVIKKNPWFGSVNYLETPEMAEMLQGGGIIDVTNTYIGIALKQGFVGLGLFLSFFVIVLVGVYRAFLSVPKEEIMIREIGRVLLAVTVAILFIITTVSPISVIAIMYWMIGAMGVAYMRMVKELRNGGAV